jgi:hypothetical protein
MRKYPKKKRRCKLMKKTELKKQWGKRIKEYKTSNMSVNGWCKTNNIKPSSFRYWLDKEKSGDTIKK